MSALSENALPSRGKTFPTVFENDTMVTDLHDNAYAFLIVGTKNIRRPVPVGVSFEDGAALANWGSVSAQLDVNGDEMPSRCVPASVIAISIFRSLPQ